ncbi:major facilitator superfamily domain-containing protein [Xylariaceae sp. FL0804]|nr:major facilitator superfamily domain-containing protein [Xylariaceae sp. FL0804]
MPSHAGCNRSNDMDPEPDISGYVMWPSCTANISELQSSLAAARIQANISRSRSPRSTRKFGYPRVVHPHGSREGGCRPPGLGRSIPDDKSTRPMESGTDSGAEGDPEGYAAGQTSELGSEVAGEGALSSPSPSGSSEYSARSCKVLAGALCLMVPTYGLLSAIGLFQTQLQEHQLSGRAAAARDVSWIVSAFGFLGTFLSFPVGVLYDRLDFRYYLPLSGLAYAAAFLALGWADTYARCLGCFVIAGASLPFIDVVAFGVVDQWFKESHSFAVGFVTVGAPVGGIFFSVVLQALFHRYSWKLAMVILAAVLAAFLLVGVLLVEPKPAAPGEPPSVEVASRPDDEGPQAGISEWTFLRSRKFFLFSYTVFIFELILYAQWGSLPAYAVYVDLGNQFYIQMTYNIGAIFARSFPPYLATWWGPFNVSLLMIAFTMAVMFGVWIPAGDRSAAALYTVAFLMGVGTGSFTPLAASCISELCDRRGYGKWIGGCYTISSFALLISNPVNQTILENLGPQLLVVIMGSILFTGFCTCLAARWLRVDHRWEWKEKV